MAQKRKRPKVTLTLDPEIRAAADHMLRSLPGKVSLSELVDQLLSDFVVTVGPMIQRVVDAPAEERLEVMNQFAGQQMLRFGEEFAKTVEQLKRQEAARAMKGPAGG